MKQRPPLACSGSDAPPRRLVERLELMSAALARPLDQDDGRLHPGASPSDDALLATIVDDGPGRVARLGLYREQRWARLFSTIHAIFPRTTRALGAWSTNLVTMQSLHAEPPRSFDLGAAGATFHRAARRALDALGPGPAGLSERDRDRSLRELVRGAQRAGDAPFEGCEAPWSLARDALSLDEAERRAHAAGFDPPWRPNPSERDALLQRRPRLARSCSLVTIRWSVVERPREGTNAPWRPPRLAAPVTVAVVRVDDRVASRALDPLLARLLAYGRDSIVSEALAKLGRSADDRVRAIAEAQHERLVDEAIAAGLWVG